jgi:hypothetical protein
VRLLPSFTVNEFDVRAQWYPPHEWFADADDASADAVRTTAASVSRKRLRIKCPSLGDG